MKSSQYQYFEAILLEHYNKLDFTCTLIYFLCTFLVKKKSRNTFVFVFCIIPRGIIKL